MDIIQIEDQQSYREFLIKIFKWLVIGLSLTFISSSLFSFSGISKYFNYMFLTIPILEIIMVIFLVKSIENLSYSKTRFWFIAYSIINGITFSVLCEFIAPGAFVLASAISVAYFGLLYAIASYTSYDFKSIGHMCLIALIPLCIGFIISILIKLPGIYMGLITLDMVLFSGITLYDFKRIDTCYQEVNEENKNVIILDCAFNLYLDFINIFYDLLMILSDLN